MPYVDLSQLGLNTTEPSLYATWLASMQASFPGYIDSPGNIEVVDATATASIAADVAQTAVQVPDAIFRSLGTKLFDVPYRPGTQATAVINVTAVDSAGYTLPVGTSVSLGAYGFSTQSALTIPNGSTSGNVVVIANQTGVAFNGAGAPVQILATGSQVNWISGATIVTVATGGVDPEDDLEYLSRLAGLLQLLAPRPITASDYATLALSFQPAVGTDQQTIGRATAIDGYSPSSATFTVTTTSSSPNLTITASPGTGILPAQGTTITGSGIPAGTLVLSASGTSIVMSTNATASASGITATVGGTVGNQRTVTIGATDASGTQWGGGSAATDTLNALQAFLTAYREVNFVVNVIAPTYTNVYVTSSIHLYPGFDPTATATAVQQAIITYLSPASFGLPPYGDVASWLQSTTIRYDKLIAVIQSVQGVDYVVNGSLKLGLSVSPTGTSDLLVPGPISLPTSSTSTVSLPTIS